MKDTGKKSARPVIQFGRFQCHFDRYGAVVNPPLIDVWSEQIIQEYIGFLQEFLRYRAEEKGPKGVVKRAVRPPIDDRMTLELRVSREPKGYYIVHVFIDGEDMAQIWCDHIAVYPGKPPMYSLSLGDFSICGLSTKLMTVRPEAKGAISQQALTALGKYVQVTEGDGKP